MFENGEAAHQCDRCAGQNAPGRCGGQRGRFKNTAAGTAGQKLVGKVMMSCVQEEEECCWIQAGREKSNRSRSIDDI